MTFYWSFLFSIEAFIDMLLLSEGGMLVTTEERQCLEKEFCRGEVSLDIGQVYAQ